MCAHFVQKDLNYTTNDFWYACICIYIIHLLEIASNNTFSSFSEFSLWAFDWHNVMETKRNVRSTRVSVTNHIAMQQCRRNNAFQDIKNKTYSRLCIRRNENGRKPPDALQFHVIMCHDDGDGGWGAVAVMLIFGFTKTRKTSCCSCSILWWQNDATAIGKLTSLCVNSMLSLHFFFLAHTKPKLGMHNNNTHEYTIHLYVQCAMYNTANEDRQADRQL